MEKQEKFKRIWAKVVAKAWSDPEFKQQLLDNPKRVLKEQGLEIPDDVHLTVSENREDALYLTLPQKPSGELSEKILEEVAAGVLCLTACT